MSGEPSDQQLPFDRVVASYHRARESGELFDTFYCLFLAKAAEIPPMFAHTDFPHQKLMLRESLLEMLMYSHTGAGREEIERLAERHRLLNVQPRHYELWLDALCEALAQHDPRFNAELAQVWRDAMRSGISLMAS
ncbi:MAG: globin [Pirellulales bacterium]|nr:globin [Pirellulales bacterium]